MTSRASLGHADVVVVGGGAAGYFAAVEAAAAGGQCLLLEKQADTGGSTALSGGLIALSGTREQAADDVDDSPELLLEDLWDISGHHADRALLQSYVDEQPSVYAWLTDHDLPLSRPVRSAGQSVPRSHHTDPGRLLSALAAEAGRAGVRVVTGARVTRLLRGADGAVVGCRVQREGHDKAEDVMARRGVVLATGGFAHAGDLLDVFAPRQRAALPIGGAGSTGDGLRMAWAMGADVRDMGFIKGTFGTHATATTTEDHKILLTFYKGSIIVNTAGRRFIDESISYKDIGDACLEQPHKLGVQVFDARIAEQCDNGIPLFDTREALRYGLLVASDDLGELACRAGVDPDGLKDTVQRYNADVLERGADAALGRTALCHGIGELLPIQAPPFYAYPSTTTLLGTYCGLRTTASSEVLDVWGDRIPGLYAAGEVTGGFHGAAYMTGSALGKAAVFGRIAGRAAAGTARGLRSPDVQEP